MSSLFFLPSSNNFLHSLASGIMARYDDDPMILSESLILLPNRRSCTELKEVFLEYSKHAMLLPKIQPIGEIGDAVVVPHIEHNPPISALEQQAILTRLVWQWQQGNREVMGGHAMATTSIDQAAMLAKTLVQFLNDVEREQISLDSLETLVPEHYAEHWHITLEFLNILSQHWPIILQDMKKISPVNHRNQMMENIIQNWEVSPPSYPVIAAGSTGSIPATRALLKSISDLQQGSVILAGVDKQLDNTSWDALEPSHPQYAFKRLLEYMEYKRIDIPLWNSCEKSSDLTLRAELFTEVMRPSSTSDRWSRLNNNSTYYANAVKNISRIDAATLQEEAKIIALQMREVLETPEKTAMLVTNESGLAERVILQLQRWDIQTDHSAGRPLAMTPSAVFMRHVLDVVETCAAPIALLSLLKHPLMAAGSAPVQCRDNARFLEREVLRGVRIAGGLGDIIALLRKKTHRKTECKPLGEWLQNINELLKPLLQCYQKENCPFSVLLDAHITVCENLAATEKDTGKTRIWGNEQGQKLADMLTNIRGIADSIGEINPREYQRLLSAFAAGEVFRPRYGAHPRLSILTPIEARLQRADKVILGGLNEGNWPKETAVDPWMNQAMRTQLGLPPHEQKIGMAAYDFIQLCQAPEVVLTRAKKVGGSPTITSRWLVRLEVVLRGLKLHSALQPEKHWNEWAGALSEPDVMRVLSPPMPKPPLSARPRALSVTQIEKLMRDPYSIYASRILNLKPLDELDQDPGAAEFGNIIHDILEEFVQNYNTIPEKTHLTWFLDCGKKHWKKMGERPAILVFWQARFERIAAWFVENEAKRRKSLQKVIGECKGEWTMELPLPFTLKARADRVEYRLDGSIGLIDYKTGKIPDKIDIERGFSSQMTLEAVMAEAGGFDRVSGEIYALEYWKLSGGMIPAEEDVLQNIRPNIEAARAGLESLITLFDNEETPYLSEPWPEMAPRYSDYRHFARVKEWRYHTS